jgi:UDP:flavonoid glycosyltransferase YjiC (YdhE family)
MWCSVSRGSPPPPPIIMSGADRPPVISCGVIPLMVSSPHTPPFGPGIPYLGGPLGRARNRVLNAVVQKGVFGGQQRHAQQVLGETIPGATLPVFFMDWQLLADSMLPLTVPGFEYPRPELAGRLRFAGAVLPRPSQDYVPPAWWGDLDGDRPVVLVTQGTIDTRNLDRVIGPTLRALADKNVLVVAATGGPPVERLGSLPANARAEQFIPFDHLLPHVSAMVTNGGYGGIHYALAHGVPLVVSGDSEDKPEAAARVAWSGAGVNLRTGDPSEKQVARAVGRLLREPRYRDTAQRLARAEHDALQTVAEVLERAAARGVAPPAE